MKAVVLCTCIKPDVREKCDAGWAHVRNKLDLYFQKKQYFVEGPHGVAKCRLLSRMLMYMYLSKHYMPKPGRSVEP